MSAYQHFIQERKHGGSGWPAIAFAAWLWGAVLPLSSIAVASPSDAKLTPVPPIAAVVGVSPRSAPPGTRRTIVVSGIWPTTCTPAAAYLSHAPAFARPAIGILLAEPVTLVACGQATTPYRFELDYTPLEAGQLEIVVMSTLASPLGQGVMVTAEASRPLAVFDVSGAWYDPATSGSGMMFTHAFGQDDAVFATWLNYDAAGVPRWYFLQDARWAGDGTQLEGTLFESRGLAPPCPLCASALAQATDRGRARFVFSVNGANGRLEASFDSLPSGGPVRRIADLVRFLPSP